MYTYEEFDGTMLQNTLVDLQIELEQCGNYLQVYDFVYQNQFVKDKIEREGIIRKDESHLASIEDLEELFMNEIGVEDFKDMASKAWDNFIKLLKLPFLIAIKLFEWMIGFFKQGVKSTEKAAKKANKMAKEGPKSEATITWNSQIDPNLKPSMEVTGPFEYRIAQDVSKLAELFNSKYQAGLYFNKGLVPNYIDGFLNLSDHLSETYPLQRDFKEKSLEYQDKVQKRIDDYLDNDVERIKNIVHSSGVDKIFKLNDRIKEIGNEIKDEDIVTDLAASLGLTKIYRNDLKSNKGFSGYINYTSTNDPLCPFGLNVNFGDGFYKSVSRAKLKGGAGKLKEVKGVKDQYTTTSDESIGSMAARTSAIHDAMLAAELVLQEVRSNHKKTYDSLTTMVKRTESIKPTVMQILTSDINSANITIDLKSLERLTLEVSMISRFYEAYIKNLQVFATGVSNVVKDSSFIIEEVTKQMKKDIEG